MKIIVAVFCGSEKQYWIAPDLCKWLLRRKGECEIRFAYHEGSVPLWILRNEVVEQALREKADWLVQVDCDQVPPENLLPIIGQADAAGISMFGVPTPTLDASGIVFNVRELQTQGTADEMFYQVSGVGGGVVATKCSLFSKLQKPFFFPRRFEHGDEKGLGLVTSEDFSFCEAIKEAGERVFATRVFAEHFRTVPLFRCLNPVEK